MVNAPIRLARCIVCAWSFLVSGTGAAADDDLSGADLAGLTLEELLQLEVRIASRIPSSMLTAPSSVEVIPQSDWQRRGARNLAEVLAPVPGVSITPALAGGDAFAIRGFTRSTSVVGVLLTWDGVPLDDLFRGAPTLNVPGLSLGAIDEVQIVEGPGSALYGAGAFHGVVGLRAFSSDDDSRQFQADVRSNDFYSASTRVSHGFGSEARVNAAFAADGQSDQDLGYSYVDPVTGALRSGERDSRYGAQSLSVKLHGGSGPVTWRGGTLLHSYDGDRSQGFGTRLSGVRDVGGIDADLILINGAVRQERSNEAALELAAYGWTSDSVLLAGRNTFDFESATEQHRFGVNGTYERQFADADTRLAVVVGAEELQIDNAITRNYDLTGTLTMQSPNAAAGAKRHVRSATFEGQTTWAAERWLLVYGARADDYSDFGGQVSPRLGLIWQGRANNAVKMLYGSAFRAPTANELRGTPGLIEASSNLQPETVTTRELVVIHQADSWFMQGTLFHSSWRDGIVSVANLGGALPFVFANLENNSSHGVTWKLNWLGDPWALEIGASWVRSENETRNVDYSAFPRYIVDAETSYRHARWKTRFYLVQHWQIDSDDVFGPSAGLVATHLPQYARTDVGAIRALNSRLNLTFAARNLFDRDNFYPSGAGSRGGIPDYPRTFSVAVHLGF